MRFRNKLSILPLLVLFTTAISTFSSEPEMSKQLQFNKNGTFKIVQFTDIHLKPDSKKSLKVFEVMETVLDAEKPDLVVLTGDIVTSEPAAKGWKAVIQPMVVRKITWAATLGNHDDESDLNKKEIITLLTGLPYSLVQMGPENLSGAGNFALAIKDSKGKNNASVLYFIDSHGYPQSEDLGSYDWIKPDQVAWYSQTSATFTKYNNNKPLPGLAFFHIPLPEYNGAWNTKKPKPIGTKKETVCAPTVNSGLLAAMMEAGDVMGTFVGHDHDNDYAGVQYGICLAYGRATGMDTYGKMTKGGRVIELVEGKRKFKSWIRTEKKVLHKINFPKSFK